MGAMAQTPVLELNEAQIGTYPYALSDADAAKVFELDALTVAVRINTATVSGRMSLFATSDPTKAANTDAEGIGSRYVGYGMNGADGGYLASWRTGDRFTGGGGITANTNDMIVTYVVNPGAKTFKVFVNGAQKRGWESAHADGFMSGYEIATPKTTKAAHPAANIYIGGAVHSGGNGEVFNGTITGIKVYSGALTAAEVAAITFEDPTLLAQAREAFNTAYAAAQTILDESEFNVVKDELPLQVTDDAASYYLWSNAPEPNEGHIKYLLDGGVGPYNGNEFFHTQWSAPVPAGPHYIEVDLGTNALSEFSFGYNTRNFDGGADFPYTIKVLASNDKESYDEIYTATGLPASSNKRWDSETIEMETEYRYIRFNVTETKTQNRTYWHMSEFDMFTTQTSIADKYRAVVNEVVALKNIYESHANNSNYSVANLVAATTALNEAVEAVNAGVEIVVPEFSYETLEKPTFTKGGGTTMVNMVWLNGQECAGYTATTYAKGTTTRFDMPQVEAGKTYNLDLKYYLDWGDLAIFQIDKDSNEKRYGYYTCVWSAGGDPFETLKASSSNLMCEELGIASVDELTFEDNRYLTVPYQITINENLQPGDITVVRVMVGKKDNGAYNAQNVTEGGCLDLVFEVAAPSHTLNVSAAGWATLYLDFNAEIPGFEGEDAGAYIVKASGINDGYITLEPVTGVLPANTGIVVKANEGSYTFSYAAEATADIEGNLLMGSVEDEVVTVPAYVLAIDNGKVGFYTATTTGQAEGKFLNNANKAYLPKTAGMSAASYSFRFPGTTAIENVEVENTVKTIYDLTGRRVEAITAPGIYIVNGKKTLVK